MVGSTILIPLALAAATPDAPPPVTQILIDLHDDTDDADEAALEAQLGLDLRLNSPQSVEERFFVAEVDPADLDELIATARRDPRVETAEPNYVYGLPGQEAAEVVELAPLRPGPGAPNDPMYSRQWALPMIGAPRAWDKADGTGVVVAVIDTGVAFEKFKKFVRVEDLDGDRFVEGYNFITDTPHANDDHGHGTHVAGTIAQSTNNGVGVAGVAPKARIMPLKVLSKRGFGTAGDIADAIRFAADEGAQVMNLSLGGGPRSRVLESAVAYARKKGVLVVCAAGNNGRPRVEYPAAYPGAFAVSSVGPTKALAFYSSYGREVAVAGPGGDKNIGGEVGGILQNTIRQDRPELANVYLSYQGTSMATPHVAGVAALVISAGVTDPDRVEAILRETAEDLGTAGRDDRYGDGLVNAAAAVDAARRTRGGLEHFLASVLGLLGFGIAAARRHGPRVLRLFGGPAAVFGALWSAVGFGILPGALGLPLVLLDLSILGPGAHFSFLWASVLPVLGLSLLFVGVPKLRGLLGGLAIGWSAHLLVTALLGGVDVLGLPGVDGWLDRSWLVMQSILLGALALAVARASARAKRA